MSAASHTIRGLPLLGAALLGCAAYAACAYAACDGRAPVATPAGFASPLSGRALARVVASAAPSVAPSCGADVGIAGLLPDPDDVPDRVGEWVELSNPGPSVVALDGWSLTSGRRSLALDGALLEPGGRLRVGRDGHTPLQPIQLSNRGGTLTLRDPCGVVIDTVTWRRGVNSRPGWRVRGRPWLPAAPTNQQEGPARSLPGGAIGGCGQT